jgi:hypothetical protein
MDTFIFSSKEFNYKTFLFVMDAKIITILLVLAIIAEIPYIYIHPELQADEKRNLEQAQAFFDEGTLPTRQFRLSAIFLIGIFDFIGAISLWTWIIAIFSVFSIYLFGKKYTKDPLYFTLLVITTAAYLLTGRFLTEKLQLIFLVVFLLSSNIILESFSFLITFTIKEMAILFIPMKYFLKWDKKHLVFPILCLVAFFVLFPDMIMKIIVHLPTSELGVEEADPVSIPRNIISLLLSLTPISIWYLSKGYKKADKGILLCGAMGLPLLLWSGSVDPRFHLYTIFFFSVIITNVAIKMKNKFYYWLPIIANLFFFLLDAYNLTHGHVLSLSSIL